MRAVILIVLVAFMSIGGCGGGDGGGNGGCDFDFDSFLNGPNAQSANSEWDCIVEDIVGIIAFQAFEDGTGFSSEIGPFTYQQTGCRSARFQSGEGSGSVVLIEGSIASGILTFTQLSDDLGDRDFGCELVVF